MYRAIVQRHAPIIGPNTAAHYDHKTKRKAEATKVESLNTDASGRRIAKHSAPSLFLRLTITIGESTTTAGICYPRWSNPAPKECRFEQKIAGSEAAARAFLARRMHFQESAMDRRNVRFDSFYCVTTFQTQRRITMLYWALVFFVVAILAGAFGFFGLAAGAAEIAKILFFVFLVLFIVSLLTGMRPRGTI